MGSTAGSATTEDQSYPGPINLVQNRRLRLANGRGQRPTGRFFPRFNVHLEQSKGKQS
jgi:hypothetical protein